jgi:hypothetical protein
MKRPILILIGMVLSLSCLNTSSTTSAQLAAQNPPVTLYSVQNHRGERRNFCLNFQTGPNKSLRADCDLAYGSLYAGADFDWFQSATSLGNRSVIKDLGEHGWTTGFDVPVVEPRAKLKPGEQRQITIDTSGADGAAGLPGADGANGADGDGVVRHRETKIGSVKAPNSKPQPPKHDGKPKIDSVFVKAVAGHVYVIHVVDDSRDFYALVRVEALEKGDNCTVSWKLIPEPVNQSGKNASR